MPVVSTDIICKGTHERGLHGQRILAAAEWRFVRPEWISIRSAVVFIDPAGKPFIFDLKCPDCGGVARMYLDSELRGEIDAAAGFEKHGQLDMSDRLERYYL